MGEVECNLLERKKDFGESSRFDCTVFADYDYSRGRTSSQAEVSKLGCEASEDSNDNGQ